MPDPVMDLQIDPVTLNIQPADWWGFYAGLALQALTTRMSIGSPLSQSQAAAAAAGVADALLKEQAKRVPVAMIDSGPVIPKVPGT